MRTLRCVGGLRGGRFLLAAAVLLGTAIFTLVCSRIGRGVLRPRQLRESTLETAWTPRWLDAKTPVPDATVPLVWLAAYDAIGADVVLFGQALAASDDGAVLAARCVWTQGERGALLYSLATEVRAEAAHCAIPDELAACRTLTATGRRTCAASRVALEVTTGNGTTLLPSVAEIPVVPPPPVRAATARRSVAERTAAFLDGNENGNAPSLRAHAVCAVTIVRNEAVYMDEYLDYHRRLGVGLFLVFDNNSTDGTAERVRAWAPRGAHVVPWPFLKSQAAAYAVGHLATRTLCNFTLFMDMDQFISLGAYGDAPNSLDLAAVLHSAVDQAGATALVSQVCLHSKMFHSSGLVGRPDASVVSTYVRARPELELNPNCAVRPVGVRIESRVHWFANAEGWTRTVVAPDVAVFNHYKEKSWVDYLRKYDGRIGLVKDWVRPANLSAEHPPPEWGAGPDVFDDSVVRFRDALYRYSNRPEVMS